MNFYAHKLKTRTIIYISLLIVVLTYAMMCIVGLGFPCLFQKYLKINCLSCGATRAFFYIIRLNFINAIKANALFTLIIYPGLLMLFVQDYLYAVMGFIKTKSYRSFIDKIFKTNLP